MLPLKTVARASMLLKNELRTLHLRVTAVYMYYNSVQVQEGSVSFCEFLNFCDVVTVLEFYSPSNYDLPTLPAMLFLPIQMEGFGFHDPITEMRNGDRDGLSYSAALASRVLKSKHIALDQTKIVARKILKKLSRTR